MNKVVVGIFIIFLLFAAAGAAYYFLVYLKEKKKDGDGDEEEEEKTPSSSDPESPSASPPASPPASPSASPAESARTTLLLTGQAIQVAELDIGKAGITPLTTPPTGIEPSNVTYTLSMDVNVSGVNNKWFSIISNERKSLAHEYGVTGTTSRRPAVWMNPENKIAVVHGAGPNSASFNLTSFKAKDNEYFNLTFVVHRGVLSPYINGVLDKSGVQSAGFTWSTAANDWVWNQANLTDRSVKVKNVYWFNNNLTAGDIKIINGQQSTSGTSTYTLPPPDTFPHSLQPSLKMCDI